MRRPRDISLRKWIRGLYDEGRIYKFYKCDEWLELRERTLEREHYECERCRERGVYSRAVTVHHVNEVRDAPELALSATYVDAEGAVRSNLVCLCARCHNEEHDRFGYKVRKSREEPLTPERW